ncbi:hypothetical protein H6777_03990 [Candidatus Nomurabacteria bacterium]|nr:hypothetical protein [Lewinellaceae bacterium]MCB9811271.1 hypothetical protein [Candidatus Nomurabacteria bacterium]
MSSSYSFNESFTITHARYLASKVASDLKRIQRFYGSPSDDDITAYEEEVAILLKFGFLSSVTYGFKRNGMYIKPTLHYEASELIKGGSDDDPGRVTIGEDVSNATFSSFLIKNSKFHQASEKEKQEVLDSLPVKRTTGHGPEFNGTLTSDKNYFSNGISLGRSSLK